MSEEQWQNYKTQEEWDVWFDNSKIEEGKRAKKLKKMKISFLKYGSIYGKKYAVKTDYGSWDSEFTLEKLQLFINHFYRVLRPGGTCIIFFDIWKITNLKDMLEANNKKGNSTMFKQIRFIEWIKTNPQPINSKVNYLTNCREIALLGIKKSKPTFNSKYDNGIYRHPLQGGKDRFHPTQKSLPLFQELIEKHSNEGDLVLDCFAGSATTAIAAMNTGRNFVGCELDKEYYQKSIERIKKNRLTLDAQPVTLHT
jgi:site-specific DNA-methyltransferase (adenine-specific)